MTWEEYVAGLLLDLFEKPIDRYDRLTRMGYKLNLITGKYYKANDRPTTRRESREDNQRGE